MPSGNSEHLGDCTLLGEGKGLLMATTQHPEGHMPHTVTAARTVATKVADRSRQPPPDFPFFLSLLPTPEMVLS